MQFLLQEKVYKARFRAEMEPADCTVKSLATLCVKMSNPQTPTELITAMKPLGSRFWSKFALACKILRQWARQATVAMQLPLTPPTDEELMEDIWQNFLRRLSLDIWYITENQTHGNDLLQLICDVAEDTIYSQFPLVNNLAGPPPCPVRLPTRRLVSNNTNVRDADDVHQKLSSSLTRERRSPRDVSPRRTPLSPLSHSLLPVIEESARPPKKLLVRLNHKVKTRSTGRGRRRSDRRKRLSRLTDKEDDVEKEEEEEEAVSTSSESEPSQPNLESDPNDTPDDRSDSE